MTQRRVLIIDDNDLNIQLASFVLSQDGLWVESAANATDGLRQIPLFQPDLILMDIQMPDMDGLTLTRRLKADPATRHIAVLAFTAYAMKGDEAKMRSAGCDGYISKPIEVATFAAKVHSYLAVAMKA